MTSFPQPHRDDLLIRLHENTIETERFDEDGVEAERLALYRSPLLSDEQLVRAAAELGSTWALLALVDRAADGDFDWEDLRREIIAHGDRPRVREPFLDRIPLTRLWAITQAMGGTTDEVATISAGASFIAHRALAGDRFPSEDRDALAALLTQVGRRQLAERLSGGAAPAGSPAGRVGVAAHAGKPSRRVEVENQPPETEYDVLVIADWSSAAMATSFGEQVARELAATAASGLRVAILQRESIAQPRALQPAEAVARLVEEGVVAQITDQTAAIAGLVVVRHAGAAQGHSMARLHIDAARVVVIDDPSSGDMRARTFARADVDDTVRGWFGDRKPDWLRVVPSPATAPQARQVATRGRADVDDAQAPVLSIVMPVYNVAPFLEAAIVSVLYQEFQDFELIVVDDASTDESARIIDMYASLDRRVRVVALAQNTIGGAGIPSNIGIRHARGRYLGFADSDDIVTRGGFARMIEAADRADADVVIGGFATFRDDLRIVEPAYDHGRAVGVPRGAVISAASHPSLLQMSPVPWRKLYRRSFIEEFAIEYPEGDYFYEDNPLHWTVLALAQSVVLIDDRVSLHRLGRAGQTMASAEHRKASYAHHFTTALRAVLAVHAEGREALLDAFVERLAASQWVVRQQTHPAARAMIAKRFAALFDRVEAAGGVVPKALQETVNAYRSGYPHRDVTVVIPVPDGAGRLRRTLEPVLATIGLSIDVLLVDQAATGETAELLRDYARRHANVHVFEQGRDGTGRAWNSVIPLITGRYALFLESGDVVEPTALRAAAERASSERADLLLGRHRFKKSSAEYAAHAAEWRSLAASQTDDERRVLSAQIGADETARLVRTELLQDANMFFGGIGVFDELPFHWQSLANAESIIIAEKPFLTRKNSVRRREARRREEADPDSVRQLLDLIDARLQGLYHWSALREPWRAAATQIMAHQQRGLDDEQR
ncbi:glycosyltransferase [Microbacterium sp. ARD32]|uniref:glycosyltransferase n=1 Tax=Microbacterium sp. ARD32 TaxID=2962577 RepID=UPI0028819B96|nr:glycosyltransferase [Microbacterium sp. ARD32]MDT0156407.1 glycosyltransferase [Microbacterium sp. ARD32]